MPDPALTADATPADDTALLELVGRLDLTAKVRLLTGATGFTLHPEPAIGLEALALSDGPTGVRGLRVAAQDAAALLPNATLLASAWSEETAELAGRILAEEAERQEIHVVLGPTINLHRSPLGGRLFEAYAEDPLLTGKLAAAYVRGLQERGIGACVKHLAANEAETQRHTVDSRVDEATLREVYLLPFEVALDEAGPWSVMAAYNRVNGVRATEQHHLQNEVLKGEWGYDGLVMSDWGATHTAAAAANGGLDLVMPGPDGPWGEALVDAVKSGEVSREVLDDHVLRLLRLADRVGALDGGRSWQPELPAPDAPTRREELTRLAAAGMTVLTNDGVLPLRRDGRVALIGRHAVETVVMGGGSAEVRPVHRVSMADGLRAALGDAVEVLDGVDVRRRPRFAPPGALLDPETGRPGMHVELRDPAGRVLLSRHVDEATTTLGVDEDLPVDVASAVLTADVQDRGPLVVGVLGVGDWRFEVGADVHEVRLDIGDGDPADAVLRPPGWTTPAQVDAPLRLRAELALGADHKARVGLGARPAPMSEQATIAAAVRAAARADVAVVAVGLTEEDETEGCDKTTLALPGAQDALVAAVAAVAPRTVVVVNAATPVLMPWLDDVDAVLWAGFPGQEAGHAVAAALLGDIEPAGRLVTTFPAADGAHPSWQVRPVDGVLEYTEGPFLGYRGYAAGRAPAPLFWFGHGLGYGHWAYGDPVLAAAEDRDGAPVLDVPVTNTGERESREVVQVYLEPAEDDQPVRLVGWSAVVVPAGGTATARVRCEPRMWRRWDTAAGTWDTLAPGGRLLVARGLGDVRAVLDLDPGPVPAAG
ncbi:MAG: glycoside hydrolase family 3 C-terminal domain-containing protein [Nocardioidaceae bacterium]